MMSGAPCTGLLGGDLGLLRCDTLAEDWFDSRCASLSSRISSAPSCCMMRLDVEAQERVSTSTQDSETEIRITRGAVRAAAAGPRRGRAPRAGSGVRGRATGHYCLNLTGQLERKQRSLTSKVIVYAQFRG